MATPISIVDIRKTFPGAGGPKGGGPTMAVDQVSLEIGAGELFFLLGPSGCGKTTLLRMIAGFTEPTRGQLLFGNRDVTHVPPNRRNTGMVFQSYALWPHMTVEANVAFGLGIRRVAPEEKQRRVREALAAVRMDSYAARKPNQLSGGQQQRVALARALVIRPDVLLLDEPLSNLDAKLRIELRSEIRRICKRAGEGGTGITTVYVTHDQKEALSMADRVAILDHGRVVQVGTPSELYRRPLTRFVAEFLGETNILEGTIAAPGSASAHPPTAVVVDTPVGQLVSGHGAAGAGRFSARAPVFCSIRPEAIWLGSNRPEAAAGNTLEGQLVETTYLGEMSQHLVELRNGWRVKVGEVNPRDGLLDVSDRVMEGDRVALSVAPADVVLVPRD